MKKPMLSYVAGPIDDDEWHIVDVRSSDVLVGERMFKGFTVSDLHPGRMRLTYLYGLAWIALKRTGLLAPDVPLSLFESSWEVSLNNEQVRAQLAALGREAEVDDDDEDAEADPTNEAH